MARQNRQARAARSPIRRLPHTPETEGAGQLSPREAEVLRLAAQGASQSAIARTLDLSPNTVKTHLRHVAEKLGATSRAEALQLATARDLVPDALQTPDRDGLVVEVLRLAAAQGLLRAGNVPYSDASRDSLPRR